MRRRSSGSSRTLTGNTSSHNDSTCPAAKRSTPTPQIAHTTLYFQANHRYRPGQKPIRRGDYFRAK